MTISKAGQIEADHNELTLTYKGAVYLRAKHPVFRPHFQNEPAGSAPCVRIARLKMLFVAAKIRYHGNRDEVHYSIHEQRAAGLIGFLRCLDRRRKEMRVAA